MYRKIKDYFNQLHKPYWLLVGLFMVTIGIGWRLAVIENQKTDKIVQTIQQSFDTKTLVNTLKSLKIQVKDSLIHIDPMTQVDIRNEILELKKENHALQLSIEESKKNWISESMNFWGILGLLLASIAVIVPFTDIILDKVSQKVSEFTDVDQETIKTFIQNENKQAELLSQTKVMVLHKSVKIDDSINKIFIDKKTDPKFDSTNKQIKNFEPLELNDWKNEIGNNQYGLVVIDNSCKDDSWDFNGDKDGKLKKQLLEFTNEQLKNNIMVLYFNDNQQHFPNREPEFNTLENKHLLAFANSHSKILPTTKELLANLDFLKN